MNKCLLTALIAILSVGLLAPDVLAGKDTDSKGWEHHGKEAREKKHAETPESLGLTEDQEAQVSQIRKTHRQEIVDWNKENRTKMSELRKKLHDARKAEDTAAIEAAEQELSALRNSRKQLNEKYAQQLKDAGLSQEQIEKLRAHKDYDHKDDRRRRSYQPFGWLLGGMELSAEQKTQIAAIHRDAIEKIKTQVLNPQQREKLAKRLAKRKKWILGGRMFAGLDLTEAQEKQIKEIHANAMPGIEAAEGTERRELVKAMNKKITEDVLTDQQREKLQQRRKHRRGESEYKRRENKEKHDD